MGNLIYMVAIPNPSSTVNNSDYSDYSIKTWQHYCNRHKIDLYIQCENVGNFKYPIWNKELISKYANGYDKIGIVDSDTMIHWSAPNIFDYISDDEFWSVNDTADLNWVMSSIKDRQRFYPNTKLNIDNYINAGVLFFGKQYLGIFDKLLELYKTNQTEIDSIDGGGKEQTLLNFQLQSEKVNIRLLDPAWNLFSIHRKNMFTHNWQFGNGHTPHFIKYAWVWHFTGFPIEQRVEIMKKTWEYYERNWT